MIQFRQISKQYNDGAKTVALDGVDLSVADGEFVFLIGDSGAGKSTLVRLLMGMEKPTSGTVLVDGVNVGQLERSKLPKFRRRFGCIFQDFQLLSDSNAYDNVAFAQRVIGTKQKNILKRVPKALAAVGLEEKAKSYPSQLSGGEQQRVAIARALVNGPLYLIADEPTGNLDQTNTDEVMALLEAFNKAGTTVIVITHDNRVVERMNKRVVELKNGRVISDTAWHTAEKATESVKPELDNAELAAPAPLLPTEMKEEVPEAAEPAPEPVPEPEPEEDDGYVQEMLDLGTEEQEEEPEQVVMDLEAITPPQPEPLPEMPKLVVPTVELPESESARKSRVMSEVLKGWTEAPAEEAKEDAEGEESEAPESAQAEAPEAPESAEETPAAEEEREADAPQPEEKKEEKADA